MIKFLIKISPALIPIVIYFAWVFVFDKLFKKLLSKKEIIEGDFKVVGEGKSDENKDSNPVKISKFSLHNRNFVIVLYISLISAIITLIFTAISN